MITKIRTNIFLTRAQQKKLRSLSRNTGSPVAVHVRRAIDEYLGRLEKKERSRYSRPIKEAS
jgi:predicted DNA-binding protein